MIKKGVTIVGAGAVGTAVAGILAGVGASSITLIDRDFVERGNLRRQLLFTKSDVGKPKATAAKERLKRISVKTKVSAVIADLDFRNAALLSKSGIVLDCTDNFETRFLINDYCRKNGIPWIYTAVIRDTGTVYCVTPGRACFRCIFTSHSGLETCDTAGVNSAAVAAAASLQASEAVKILTEKDFEKCMVRIKVDPLQLLKLKVKKNRDCPCCSGKYEYLGGKKGSKVVKLCGTGVYHVAGKPVNLKLLVKRMKGRGVKDFGYCLHSGGITLFRDGRAIVKASSPERAKSAYSRMVGRLP